MSIPQQSVYGDLPLAIEGDFASANPRASMLASESQLVAGPLGVTVGRFAFASLAGLVSNSAPGAVSRVGFVHRDQPGIYITQFLGQSSLLALAGTPITLFDDGDFFCRFAAGVSTLGLKVYASLVTGLARAGVTGAPTTNALITADTATNTTLTVTANTGAALAVGMPVSGAGIPAGTIIAALGTGTGGAGTYTLSQATTATASGVTVTATTEIETRWYADLVCSAGELSKISTRG